MLRGGASRVGKAKVNFTAASKQKPAVHIPLNYSEWLFLQRTETCAYRKLCMIGQWKNEKPAKKETTRAKKELTTMCVGKFSQ